MYSLPVYQEFASLRPPLGGRTRLVTIKQTPGNSYPTHRMAVNPPNRNRNRNHTLTVTNGVGTNFGVGVEEARPEGPRAWDGVLGEGTASPSPPTRGLPERCKLPQRGSGQSPGCRRVFLYSETSDCLSQHLSTCCIQFAWLGIRFF